MITVIGESKSTEELRDVPFHRPTKAGRRWQGIRHYDLATAVEAALLWRGIELQSEIWSVDQSGQSLVGGINLQFPARLGIPAIDGMDYSLGIRHTNDLRYALTFAVGTQIIVCHNGVVTGAFVLCRKHTSGINLVEEVERGIDRFVQEARKVPEVIDSLKARSLTRRQTDHRLMEAGRQRLIPWSHVGQVHHEYEHPTHGEFAKRTGWGLYNAFNYIVKKGNPQRQLRALDRFREIVLN